MIGIDDIVHPVATQWHYPIMIKYGYIPDTLEAKGMVRSYQYTHQDTGRKLILDTGAHCDWWKDLHSGHGGLHGKLEQHLINIGEINET